MQKAVDIKNLSPLSIRCELGGVFYVYEHWRPDEDRCFYVGKGYGKRAHQMYRRNIHHKRIQALLMRDGLEVQVRFVAMGLSESAAFTIEREMIAMWKGQGVKLANLTEGGQGTAGLVRSDENKRKISEAHKGRKHDPAVGRAHSERMRGRKQSPDVVERRASSLRGQKRTLEQREKIAASRRGKPFSEEHRANLSKARRAYIAKRAETENCQYQKPLPPLYPV